MPTIALVGDKGCLNGSTLPNGSDGQVLTMVGGEPAFADAAADGGTTFDPCAMTAAEIGCMSQSIDFAQLTPAQVTALGTVLQGLLVEDAFGVPQGYLLPL